MPPNPPRDTPVPLTDTTIKNAKPTPDKSYKLPDEKGMYLLVNPNGSKYFRLKYLPLIALNLSRWNGTTNEC